MRPANNDQLLAYHHLHEQCHLLPQEEQLAYIKSQRPGKPTIEKRKERESDEESEGSMTNPDLSHSSNQEESGDDEPRKVDLIDREFDDAATEDEKEQTRPNPIVKRSSERHLSEDVARRDRMS